MEKYIEVTGKNEDAAIEKGLAQLGLSRDDVSVEVLERAKTGFLGIGSSPAKVKLTYQVPDEPVVEEKAEKPAPAVEPAAPPQAEPAEETFAPAEQAQAKEKPASGEKAEQIERFLTGLMEHLDNDAEPVITQGEDGTLPCGAGGRESGRADRPPGRDPGRHPAADQLRRQPRAGQAGPHPCGRRELPRQAGGDVWSVWPARWPARWPKYRRNVTLEPMNAYERHVIHAALQDYEGVTTYSTGSEPNRRVVVACER